MKHHETLPSSHSIFKKSKLLLLKKLYRLNKISITIIPQSFSPTSSSFLPLLSTTTGSEEVTTTSLSFWMYTLFPYKNTKHIYCKSFLSNKLRTRETLSEILSGIIIGVWRRVIFKEKGIP